MINSHEADILPWSERQTASVRRRLGDGQASSACWVCDSPAKGFGPVHS